MADNPDMFLVTTRGCNVLGVKAGRNRRVAEVHTLLILSRFYLVQWS